MGTGGLAIIIPPSALAVLLATLAQIDVAALLIAGVIPGLVLASFYIATIWIQTQIDPTAAPAYEVERLSLAKKFGLLLREVIPMVSVMIIIIVLMIQGFVTPSEGCCLWRFGRACSCGLVSLPHLGGHEKICHRGL